MARPSAAVNAFLKTQHRSIATIAVTVLMANTLVVVSRAFEPETDGSLVGAPRTFIVDDPSTLIDESTIDPATGIPYVETPGIGPLASVALPSVDPNTPSVVVPVSPRSIVRGVTDTEIRVAYYWKGERTQSSPFLEGTAAEGANLDEELAFRAYVDYINKHADGSATLLGLPINLHGRKLVPIVDAPKDGASGDFAYSQLAVRLAEKQPFAAIASHGSISSYICPYLAEHGIFNMQTYDLGGDGGNLVQRTNGYCLPAGLSWERQIELTIGYLKRQMTTNYLPGIPRVYGVIYTVYPGLRDVGEAMVQRLKDAGIPIADSARLPDSLANAQPEAQSVLLEMRKKGVNTLIMPDAGSPLVITHAAQAQEYYPDYYVWPCSGLDNTGMVRLFNGAQWEGAEGLTCYDREFDSDAVNNSFSRKSEWWKAYQEVRPGKEPPAPAPLVYAGLAQLVLGLTYAGRDLLPETFQAGLDLVPNYRYDAVEGKTNDPTNMLMTMGVRDRSFNGDAAYVKWDPTASEGGAQGAYRYPEDHRYRDKADFG